MILNSENKMLLGKLLTPDLILPSYTAVTPEVCRDVGATALICDIDNTLATYDDEDMPEPVEKWVNSLKEAGIGVAFVSNNAPKRVKRFIGRRKIKGYPDAHKPSGKYYMIAKNELGEYGESPAVLGDQLLTDALAAHRVGMKAIIVPPIKDRTGIFFRFKRAVEKPFIRKYLKTHPVPGLGKTVWH